MTSMRLLFAAVGAAAVIATPALATSSHKGKASHAYASQTQPDATNSIIGWDGRPLGTDPDPNIRFQIMRDQSQGGD
ncbi:MAG TPA: hypothetical protein VEC94_17180 [Pseudolabrys sp.]|nr:hypothetical protein [Pseudolabrys sp.]